MSRLVSDRTMQMTLDREAGMTCREIAEKYGVSYQRVQAVVGKYSPPHFQYITERGCIYPNLRTWMNTNKVSRSELVRRMGLEAYPNNIVNLSSVIVGRTSPRKAYIDRMLQATGMTYETLFYTEKQEAANED